jgi:hypothetical protein
MPLETPIGIATAARDYIRERRRTPSPVAEQRVDTTTGATPQRSEPLERRLARAVKRATARVDMTRHLAAKLGRAAAIRGLYRLQ